MNWLRRGSSEPLWKEEFSVRTADERYVTRRQLTKFLVLTSLGMFVGNIWILIRSIFYKTPIYPQQPVAQLGEIPEAGTHVDVAGQAIEVLQTQDRGVKVVRLLAPVGRVPSASLQSSDGQASSAD